MNDIGRIKRNIILFAIFSTVCGWAGYGIDKLADKAHYENIGTMAGEEPLGMLIWLISPMICTIMLRSFGGDGWKNSGFSLNFRENKKFYLIGFVVYPAVTLTVILLGLMTKAIRIFTVLKNNMRLPVLPKRKLLERGLPFSFFQRADRYKKLRHIEKGRGISRRRVS